MFSGFGQGDGHALAAGASHPSDPVDVGLRIRRDVVVDHVGQLVDVQPAGSHVGGHDEVGGAGSQPSHHPVALGLVHPAVHRLGPIPAAVQRLGELIDLRPGTAEQQRRCRRFDVQNPAERRRLVRPGNDVGALPNEWGLSLARPTRAPSGSAPDRAGEASELQQLPESDSCLADGYVVDIAVLDIAVLDIAHDRSVAGAGGVHV